MVALLVVIRSRIAETLWRTLVWINQRKRGAARSERPAVTWKRGNVGFEVS